MTLPADRRPPSESRAASDTTPRLASAAGVYRERPPATPLRDHLRVAWSNTFTGPEATVNVVPDGSVDLVWTGERLQVAGPDTQPVLERLPSNARVAGLRFRPGMAPPWLGVPASELVNQRVPLCELWGSTAEHLSNELRRTDDPAQALRTLEAALLTRLPGISRPDPAVRGVHQALAQAHLENGPPEVQELAATLGLSERTLRRRCEHAFGYGPRTLARILRFQRFLQHLRAAAEPRLADLALLAGFADQAHLSREARELGGLTPTGFLRELRGP